MSAKRQPDATTRGAQNRASDPAHSAWVSAHAGSGKTHVLASRVIRLLLDGVPPSRILCLTFTKAAAANMSARVLKTLAEWAVADDDTLRAALASMGANDRIGLDVARTLFARAVETPGGLKIQTIHAFCERVLHLFPFEANVPSDFRVLEQTEQAELLAGARSAALAYLSEHSDDTRSALARVADGTWDGGFIALVNEMLGHRRTIAASTPALRTSKLREVLGLSPQDSEATIVHAILSDGITRAEWPAIVQRLSAGSANDQKCATKLSDILGIADEAAVRPYLDLFRKSDGDWRTTVITRGLAKANPDLDARLASELARLPPLFEKWLAVRTVARTHALDLVCTTVLEHYAQAKQARAFLDFDDLIDCTRQLLTDAHASQWVLYKLDGGIDHILVDEAQDTSEPQWQILEALAGEFSVGAGRARGRRTFFAVGDEKQSIFSFQGAAPAKFEEMRRTFERKTRDADEPFARVALHVSFRSAPDVLRAVDTVFQDETHRRGLSSDLAPLLHDALKHDLPGLVEIWPPVRASDQKPPESWLLPVDATGEHEPPAKLAQKIATKISHLVDPARGEVIEGATPGSTRPITPGDIMILVRRRDAFFEAMIRTLKDKRIAVAGADRLNVVGHIAVMDCVAAARVALLPEDDLFVATILKSPLIGLDDSDLIALAPGRAGTLYGALRDSTDPRHMEAAARIARWIDAARHDGPFDFFSRILGAEGGRRALLARLGAEANDALDEFLSLALAHERTEASSLVTFLARLESLTLDVKRDLESAHDAVRVMTVHAAKGLEAKVVFLPDTCSAWAGQFDPAIYALDTPGGRTLAWSARKADDPAPLLAARDASRRAEEEEYRRLLYVAMTRAEERLYIAGYYNKVPPKPDCWHSMVSTALRPHSEELPDALEDFGEILRFGKVPSVASVPVLPAAVEDETLPEWLTRPARVEAAPAPPLRPSSALASADRQDDLDNVIASRNRLRGLAIHALLQRLPDVSPLMRRSVVEGQIATRWPVLEGESATILKAVNDVIDHADLAPLFGAGALAEVAIAADLPRDKRPPVRIMGQIDRLAETRDGIIVAEYKTGALTKNGPAPAHVAQIALYREALKQMRPGKRVIAVLVYTDGPHVLSLSEDVLDHSAAKALDTAA